MKKPRISKTTFESKLETIPLSTPVPLASIPEVAPSEEALLTPITPPAHVKHVHTSLPTLSQILDKESRHQTHATKHATLNDPISNLKSEPSADIFVPPNTLLNILQSITTLKHNTTKMETEIASLKEDNGKLRLFIHEHLNSSLNKLAKIMIDKIDQASAHTLNNHTKEFETVHKNILVINDNIKNISLGNQVIEEKVVSLEEKLASTTVKQKLNKLENTIKNLQLLKSDTTMDTTPMPHSNMPLPPATSNPIPSPFSRPGQPTRQSAQHTQGLPVPTQPPTWPTWPTHFNDNKPLPTKTVPKTRNTRVI